ncbi:hypothetical protein [Ekhidna sp.]|uniref:hypothetical protein n=1 Tax=Ekhidna sp. TaxID=2608089 RepID=UPI003C7A1205
MLRKTQDEIEYNLILEMSNEKLSPLQIFCRAKEIANLLEQKQEKYPALDIEGLFKEQKRK